MSRKRDETARAAEAAIDARLGPWDGILAGLEEALAERR